MKLVRTVLCSVVLLALVASVGCASVSPARNFNGLALENGKENVFHINGSSSGLYFLWIPLITGNTDDPYNPIPLVLQDTATADATGNMLSAEAKNFGATSLLDVQSTTHNIWIAPTFVLFWKTTNMSGNAVK